MRDIKRILLLLVFLVAGYANLHAQSDEVYLKNGEFYSGEIIAVGTDILLIRTAERIFSIQRPDIRYVFREQEPINYTSPSTYQPVERKPEVFDTLDRFYLIEVGGGLYSFSNFALSMYAIHWFRINDKWSLGAIGALDFSKYVMFRLGVQTKRTFVMSESVRSYFLGGVAIGPWAANFINNTAFNVIDTEFSPVFQTNFGAGIWFDTGSKIAFIGEGGLSINRFRVTETVRDFAGNRSNVIDALNVGPYFKVGMVF